jgi:hypothetical protein
MQMPIVRILLDHSFVLVTSGTKVMDLTVPTSTSVLLILMGVMWMVIVLIPRVRLHVTVTSDTKAVASIVQTLMNV